MIDGALLLGIALGIVAGIILTLALAAIVTSREPDEWIEKRPRK